MLQQAKISECRSHALEQAVAELDNSTVNPMFARYYGGGAPVLYASR